MRGFWLGIGSSASRVWRWSDPSTPRLARDRLLGTNGIKQALTPLAFGESPSPANGRGVNPHPVPQAESRGAETPGACLAVGGTAPTRRGNLS